MKKFLLILLIGLITSKLCASYNQGRVKQKKSFGSCPCPHGMVGLVDPDMSDCYCYYLSQISECKADKSCRFDNYVGCYN